MPDAASVFASGFGVCASPAMVMQTPRIATNIARNVSVIVVPRPPEGGHNLLERILESDERRDLVADAVAVEREQQVGVDEQTSEHVHLRADRAVQHLKRIAAERDVLIDRRAVERMEVLRREPFGVDDVPAEEVEHQREM